MAHKAGFVNIIGNPNVGKSTLMNAMVGEKLSIITSKAQTTRHRIFGIVNEEDYQIVYSDTPGILEPKYELHQAMLKFVEGAFADADILLYITDKYDREPNETFINMLKQATVPVLLVINKIDLCKDDAELVALMEKWQTVVPNAKIINVSALLKFQTDVLLKLLLENLPEHEPYFPKDELTDKPMRFFVSEIIREKIFLYYHLADICMVTSLDDGMNLVAKEFAICNQAKKGMLLSLLLGSNYRIV